MRIVVSHSFRSWLRLGNWFAARHAFMTVLVLLGVAWTPAEAATSQPELLSDMQTYRAGSYPGPFVHVGSTTYFTAGSFGFGAELWRTDGTAAGTVLVSDIRTGRTSSSPSQLVSMGGSIYFVAHDGINGAELWTSDGTAVGTVLVADIRSGSSGSSIAQLTVVGSALYFVADDGTHGAELWTSDGTTAGTQLVSDLRPGTSGSSPSGLTSDGNSLWFAANDGVTGSELWRVTGTTLALVRDIAAGSASSSVAHLTPMGGLMYFQATTAAAGAELWVSDGTDSGTVLVADIEPGLVGSQPSELTARGTTLFFAASTSALGQELWRSDGTAAGTVLVQDIRAGSSGSALYGLSVLGTQLMFQAHNGSSGAELWSSDGTAAGTVLVADISVGSGSSSPSALTPVGSLLYFAAYQSGLGIELWASDGTTSGTYLVRDIYPGWQTSYLGFITPRADGNGIYFSGNDGIHQVELWTSQGLAANTTLVSDIDAGTASGSPNSLTLINGMVIYTGFEGERGHELWGSNGTPAGTSLICDIQSGWASSTPADIVNLNGLGLFAAQESGSGRELWISDGTFVGTVLLADIRSGSASSSPSQFVSTGSLVFFEADNGIHGKELWVSDGTAAGTNLVKDIRVGAASAGITSLTAVGGRVFFAANNGTTGAELWVSDGTSGGTQFVADIRAGSSSSDIRAVVDLGGVAYFAAQDGIHGQELWRSDGTSAGTYMVADQRVGPYDGLGISGIRPMTVWNNRLYYSAGGNVMSSDGTAAGITTIVGTNPSGLAYPREFTPAANGIYFVSTDGVSGNELWFTDGTTAGSHQVADIGPGSASGEVSRLTPIADGLIFTATDGIHGVEYWYTDGVETTMVADLAPGPVSCVDDAWVAPGSTLVDGNRAYIAAGNQATGIELWTFTVLQAPVITWANPPALPAGSALSATQLNASASVAGTFSYNPPAGTILSEGMYTLMATFTPTDSNAYTVATAQVILEVTTANTPPVITMGPTATPEPVIATTTNLTVVADDDGGEPSLTYLWSANTPAAVSFSHNSSNAAQTTVATFNGPGVYLLSVQVSDPSGLSITDMVQVQVAATLTSLTVTPATSNVVAGSTQLLSAASFDQFNQPLVPQSSVVWSVDGGGIIDSEGLFTAGTTPADVGTHTITATTLGLSATAAVIISAPDLTAPTIVQAPTIQPAPVTGTTAALTVFAADADAPESELRYDWTITGPAEVTMVPNNSNQAKISTATFQQAGVYNGTVMVTDADGRSVVAELEINVAATVESIALAPLPLSTFRHGQFALTATVLDQFANVIPNPDLTWSLAGGGSVTEGGVYTATDQLGEAIVSVTSGIVTTSASTFVFNTPPTVVIPAVPNGLITTGYPVDLIALGADDLPESTLTYQWQASGPGQMTVSVPGASNEAQHITATFDEPGLYVVQVIIIDADGEQVVAEVGQIMWTNATDGDLVGTSPTGDGYADGDYRVSPLPFEIVIHSSDFDAFATPIIATVDGSPVSARALSPHRVVVDVPLSAHGAVQLESRIARSAPVTVDKSFTWKATPIMGIGSQLVIRLADSLLLTATAPSGCSVRYEFSNGQSEVHAESDSKTPISFTTAGPVTVMAYASNGVFLGKQQISVVPPPFLKERLPCEVKYTREINLPWVIHAEEIRFLSTDDEVLTVTGGGNNFDDYGNGTVNLTIKPLKRGTPQIVARLLGATGPVLAVRSVDEFILERRIAERGLLVLYNSLYNKRCEQSSQLVMRPWIQGVKVSLSGFVKIGSKDTVMPLFKSKPDAIDSDFIRTSSDGEVIGIFTFEIPSEYKYVDKSGITTPNSGQVNLTPKLMSDDTVIGPDEVQSILVRSVELTIKTDAQGTATGNYVDSIVPIGMYGRRNSLSGTRYIYNRGPLSLMPYSLSYDVSIESFPDDSPAVTEQVWRDLLISHNEGTGMREEPMWIEGPRQPISWQQSPLCFDQMSNGYLETTVSSKWPWVRINAISFIDQRQFAYLPLNSGYVVPFVSDGAGGSGYYDAGGQSDARWTEYVRRTFEWVTTNVTATIVGESSQSISHQYWPQISRDADSYPGWIDVDDPDAVDTSTIVRATLPLNGKLFVNLNFSHGVMEDVKSEFEGDLEYTIRSRRFKVHPYEFASSVGLVSNQSLFGMPKSITITRPGVYLIKSGVFFKEEMFYGTVYDYSDDYDENYFKFTCSPFVLIVDGFGVDAAGRIVGDVSAEIQSSQLPTVGVSDDGSLNSHLFDGFGLDTVLEDSSYQITRWENSPIDISTDSMVIHAPITFSPISTFNPNGSGKEGVQDVILNQGSSSKIVSLCKLSAGLGLPDAASAVVSVNPSCATIDLARDNLVFSIPMARFGTQAWGPNCDLTYNSQDATVTALGLGWRTTYDQRIMPERYEMPAGLEGYASQAWFIDESGCRVLFALQGPIENNEQLYTSVNQELGSRLIYRPQTNPTADDAWEEHECWRLARSDNIWRYFNKDGRLVRMVNVRGEMLHVELAAKTQLPIEVSDDYGRVLDLKRSAFHEQLSPQRKQDPLTGIAYKNIIPGPGPVIHTGQWSFTYDDQGNMTSMTAHATAEDQFSLVESISQRTWRISYLQREDKSWRITQFTQPVENGNELTTTIKPRAKNTDTEYRVKIDHGTGGTSKVVYGTTLGGYLVRWEQVDQVPASSDLNGEQVSITEASRVSEQTVHAGRLIKASKQGGRETHMDYDHKGRLIRREVSGAGETVASPNRVETFEWGSLTEVPVIDALDTSVLSQQYLLDVTGLTGAAEGTDLVTTWTYVNGGKATGNVESIIASDGATTTYTYDSKGFQKSVIDARNKTWTVAGTDTYGNITKLQWPSTANGTLTESWTSRANGDVLTHTAADGTLTATAYDSRGRACESLVGPAGQELFTQVIYDPLGRVIQQRSGSKSDGPSQDQVATTHRDGLGRPVLVCSTGLADTTISWTENDGTWTSETTRAGVNLGVERFDSSGRLCESRVQHARVWQYPVTNPSGTLTLSPETQWEVTRMAYHATEGWLTSATTADGGVTMFEQDGFGQVLQTTNALGGVAKKTTNALGWTLNTVDVEGRTVSWRYDGAGRVREQRSPSGARTDYGYDSGGHQLFQRDGSSRGIQWEYDATGALASVTDVFGKTTTITTDVANRTQSIHLPTGETTHQSWNEKLQTTSSGVRLGSGGPEFVTNYHYPKDNGSSIVQTPGRADQFVTVDIPTQSSTHTAYGRLNGNNNAEMTSVTQADGEFGQIATQTDVTFGAAGEPIYDPVTREINGYHDNRQQAGTSRSVSWTVLARDRMGRPVVTMDGDHIRTLKTYDLLGRVAVVHQAGREAVTRTWSGVAQSGSDLISTQVGSQAAMLMTYNVLGQQTSVTRSGYPTHTSMAYDAWGRLIEQLDQERRSCWLYDPFNGVGTISIGPGGERTIRELDEYGQLFRVTDQATGQTITYDRNEQTNRVSQVTYSDGRRREYDYDDQAGGAVGEVREVGTDAKVRVTKVLERDGMGTAVNIELPGNIQVRQEPSVWNGTSGPMGRMVQTVVSQPGVDDDVTVAKYDTGGRSRAMTLPGQSEMALAYTNGGRLLTRGSTQYGYNDITGDRETVTQDGVTISMKTDGFGRVHIVELPGVQRVYDYDDQAGWMIGLTHWVGDDSETHSALRDRSGRLVQLSEPDDVVTEFGYDDRQRLCMERRIAVDGWIRQYGYDVRDNRTVDQSVMGAQLNQQAEYFNDEVLPSTITPHAGTWSVTPNRLNVSASPEGIADANWNPDTEHLLRLSFQVDANPLEELGQTTTAWIAAGLRIGTTAAGEAVEIRAVFERTGATVVQRAEVWAVPSDGPGRRLGGTESNSPSTGSALLTATIQPNGNVWLRLLQAVPQDAFVRVGMVPGNYGIIIRGEAADVSASIRSLEWDGARNNDLTTSTMIYTAGDRLSSRIIITGGVTTEETYDIDGFGRQAEVAKKVSMINGETVLSKTTYDYDDINRLTAVYNDDVEMARYAYLGTSWQKRSATTNGQTTSFTWEGSDLRAQTLASHTTTFGHVNGQPMWEQPGASPADLVIYGRDLRGSISGRIGMATQLHDPQSGATVWLQRRTYDGYGQATAQFRQADDDGTVSYQLQSTIGTGFGFQGGWHDSATGLTQFQNRWYAPHQAGRWTQVDPAQAGRNWYAYCGGDPVNRSDPSGLDWVAFEGDDVYYYHEQDSWWPGRQSSGRTKIGTRGQGDLIQLDGAFQREGRSMVEIGLLNEYAAGDFSGDTGWGMTSAKLNIRKAQSGNLPFSAWTAIGSELDDQNVKSSIVIYNGITFGFDSDAQREVPKIIAEAKANGDTLTLTGYGFGEGGGRGLTAALGARGLQFGVPLLARGAAAIPYGTATLTGIGTGLQVTGAAGTGWFTGTAINEAFHGNAYEATSALTDATNLGVGSFGSLFPRGAQQVFRTWNQFQSGTRGQFPSRAEGAQAWAAYKLANNIVTGSVRNLAVRAQYLRSLVDDYRTPSWMKQWLSAGRVPPGYEVDHIKPLSVGGEDAVQNMRLQLEELHKIHHKFYRPWEW